MKRRPFHTLVTAARVFGLILLPLLLFAWAESYFHDELFSVVADSREGDMLLRQIWSVRSARGGVNLEYVRALNSPHNDTIERFKQDVALEGKWRWYRGIVMNYPTIGRPDRNPLSWLGIDWRGWEADARTDPRFGRSEVQSPGVIFPYWLATLILAAFILPWLRRTRQLRRRAELGLCLTCG